MRPLRRRQVRIFLFGVLTVATLAAVYAVTMNRRPSTTEAVQLVLCGEPLTLPNEFFNENFLGAYSDDIARGEPIHVCNIFCFNTNSNQSTEPDEGTFRLCLLPENDDWLRDAFLTQRGDASLQTETGKPEALVRRAFDGIETIGLTDLEGSLFSHSIYVDGTDESIDDYRALCSFTKETDESPLCEIQFQVPLRKTQFFAQITIVGRSEVIKNWSIETTSALDRIVESTD